MTTPTTSTAGRRRAWGWVRHLLDGGTTPWAEWTAEAEPVGRVIPGAQQLELLRRLNAETSGGLRVPPALARRVLEASAPGRGQPDLELLGAADDTRFGAGAVDPSALREEELLRVATYLLAEDLIELGPVERRPDRLPRPWRRRYRVVGDPLLADPLRRGLVAGGHPPRPGGEIVVLGSDLGRMLADVWTSHCFDHGVGSWASWLETWRQRGQVPPRVDLPKVLRTWEQRRGADHVHLLLEGSPEWARLPELVGVRRPELPPRPGARAAELSRRVAAVLGVMVTPPRRTLLLREGLLPRLPDDAFGPAAPLPQVTAEHREWVERRARRMSGRLRRAGRPVDLSLPGGVASAEGREPSPHGDGVLSLAVRMLLDGRKDQV
ncbi:hypothetical protein [Nocardioides campestrisoli]|uniref:hypothetical protein n=1 Tax=Nocardioides campestrisoli TaxID=2736757 RepID=UPI0015E76CDB|nr:hypothetical protein [Nocardioides campestrisoli]